MRCKCAHEIRHVVYKPALCAMVTMPLHVCAILLSERAGPQCERKTVADDCRQISHERTLTNSSICFVSCSAATLLCWSAPNSRSAEHR